MKLNAFNHGMPSRWLPLKRLLIMKLTTFILAITLMQVSAKGFGQKISLNENKIPLERLFQSIEKRSGYSFFYKSNDIPKVDINIHMVNASIEEVLKESLKNLSLSYKIVDNNIVIAKKEKQPEEKFTNVIKRALITGQVIDENDKPLAGVNIKMADNPTGWISDNDGKFNIELSNEEEATLVFSYVGYKTKEVKIRKSVDLKIKMELDFGKLYQVMVIGYGSSTRRNTTGSIYKIGDNTLSKIPTGDPILALQGRAPGLLITPVNGLPGADVNVQIRGINSLNRAVAGNSSYDRSNTPLFVVDGVPFVSEPLNNDFNALNIYSPGGFGTNTSVVYASPFKSINQADIESIEVLKDADATAIYGARGANGVILITTKRGKSGRTKFDVDVYNGISQVTRFNEMYNTSEYLAMRREAFRNDSVALGPFYSPPSSDPSSFGYAPDLAKWDPNAYTNWQKKYAGSNASTLNVQTSLTGGNEQTTFLFNAGYRKQNLVTPGDYGLEQGSFRLNLDHSSADKRFSIAISTAYSTDLNKTLRVDPFQFYNLAPNFPLYNSNGSLNWELGTNPEAELLKTGQDRTSNLMGNLSVGYKILHNLHFKTNLGYNKIQLDQFQITPIAASAPGSGSTNIRNQGYSNTSTALIEPQLDYKPINGNHNLQVLIGGTYQQTATALQYLEGRGFTNDDLMNDLFSASEIRIAGSNATKYRYLSAFGRISYNFKGKYLMNLTARRDGSSRFGPGKRFGNFGAIGAAWIFTEEAWMKKLSFLSFGKLRGSYGITGNDKIGDYLYYDSWKPTTAIYQTRGVYSSNLFNPDFQWETNKKLELAIDLGLLKDRVSLSVDYYRNRSGNQLVTYPVASQSGYTGVTANLDALVQNSGWEFDLNTINIKSSNFTWSTAFNMSIQRNKLLRFPGLEGSPYRSIYQIGESISNVVGYVFESVDPQTGIARYKDLNGNGTFDDLFSQNPDQQVIANRIPAFYGGFNNSFSYKSWQLDVFFNYRKLDKTLYSGIGAPGSMFNQNSFVNDRWQKPNDVASIPMYSASFSNPVYIDNAFNLSSSTRALVNGSYLRLSNLALSYTLPKGWVKRMKIERVRLYASGQNLLLITKYPGPDPETGLGMPTLRTIVLGARVTL